MGDSSEQPELSLQNNEPSSSSSKDLNKTLPEEAFNNFLQGKRHMLVKDFQFAAQSLATACEMYVKHFGELAIECGEVYFLYGKSLFRLSQQQAGVLGGALNDAGSNEEDGNSSDEEKENDSEEKENDSEEKENDSEEKENEETGEKENEDKKDSGDADKETEVVDEEDDKEPSESTDSPQPMVVEGSEASEAKPKDESTEKPADTTASSSTEAEKKPEDATAPDAVESTATENQVTSSDENKPEEPDENKETEEDDLELAWITLETAKSIFQRQNTVESQLKVAEILQLLAEISMESDNNAAAINDLKSCLDIQTKHLKPDDRILAESYYQMGLALLLDKQYYEALDNFKTTKQILHLRLENLKNTPIEESAGSFASADRDAEVSDLESILGDIQEKIEDTEELIRDAKKELEDAFKTEAVCSPVKEIKEKGTTLITAKPVSNITHLLKRKKPEDAIDENEAKRIKTNSVTNGDTTTISPSKIETNREG